jgi:hypothetical protein
MYFPCTSFAAAVPPAKRHRPINKTLALIFLNNKKGNDFIKTLKSEIIIENI